MRIAFFFSTVPENHEIKYLPNKDSVKESFAVKFTKGVLICACSIFFSVFIIIINVQVVGAHLTNQGDSNEYR